MTSRDMLSARSMEVGWDDGSDVRKVWSSWTDTWDNSWYGAETLLPSNVTHISVSFKIRGPGGPWPVSKVDRRHSCAWVMHDGRREDETILFRHHAANTADPVDVTFELRGPANACYVGRAWNAANMGIPSSFELWDEIDSRPQ